MKPIFVYTIENSGGRFLQSMLKANHKASDFKWLGEVHLENRGLLSGLKTDNISKEWLANVIADHLKEQEKRCKVVAFHSHYSDVKDKRMASFQSEFPGFSVVCSMRDPLLIANTARWTRYILGGPHPNKESKELRLEHVKRIAQLAKNTVLLPSAHAFVCPVDTAERYSRFENLFEFCGVEFSAKAKALAKAWVPIGMTSRNSTLRHKGQAAEFLEYKHAILDRDIEDIERLMDVEFKYLRRQRVLQRELRLIGYRNLSWWKE